AECGLLIRGGDGGGLAVAAGAARLADCAVRVALVGGRRGGGCDLRPWRGHVDVGLRGLLDGRLPAEQQRGGGVDGGRADGLVVQLLGGRPRRGGAQNVRERVRVRGAGAVAAVLQLHGAVQGERPSQGLLLVDEGL